MSYDDTQLGATLHTCEVCKGQFYMTNGRAICIPCRKWLAQIWFTVQDKKLASLVQPQERRE